MPLILVRSFVAAGLFMALVVGCADLKTDLPTPASSAIRVHDEGWTDEGSANFHGRYIASAGWDLSLCQSCHGRTYDGGTVSVSCRTCHDQPAGPENCATCHGSTNPAPPRDLGGSTAIASPGVGAHQKHLTAGSISSATLCSDCHSVPTGLRSPGHVDSPLPAEVPMNSSLARTVTNEVGTPDHTNTLPQFSPEPSWSAGSLSCANTYCHGNFKNGNPTFAPVWNDVTGTQAACGTCHGDPSRATAALRARPKTPAEGGTHPAETACADCHSPVVDASLKFVDKSKHINGKLEVFGEVRDF